MAPRKFRDAVDEACAARYRGDLWMLADEAGRSSWAADGRRLVEIAAQKLDAAGVVSPSPDRTVIFSGHMVDGPAQAQPRFPPTDLAEREARRLIDEAVAAERGSTGAAVWGLAGGACGGDILFHEVCADRGIETQLFLALPEDQFIRTSVQQGGSEWVTRFRRLCERLKPRVLADAPVLPEWVQPPGGDSFWQRNNRWMLFNALAQEARQVTLLALWDDAGADLPGGTGDLVAQAQARGLSVRRLPAERLKALR